MIKKLRNRFIFVNMLLLTVLTMGVFFGIYVSMYRSGVALANDVISAAFDRHGFAWSGGRNRNFFIPNDDPNIRQTAAQISKTEEIITFSLSNFLPQEKANSDGGGFLSPEPLPNDKPAINIPRTIQPRGDTVYIETDKYQNIRRAEFQIQRGDNAENALSLENAEGAAKKILKTKTSPKGLIEYGGESYRYEYKITLDNCYAIVLLNRTEEISSLRRLFFTLLLFLEILFPLYFAISYLLSKWVVKPISLAWDKQKQFVSDASHELKTPLAVIATNVDLVLSSPDDTIEGQSRWLSAVKSEIVRMKKLVDDLLKIARTDAGSAPPIYSDFSLSDVADDVCINFETYVFEQGKTFVCNIAKDVFYHGFADDFRQLLTILIDNALKYSPKGAVVEVSLSEIKSKSHKQKAKKVRLSVSNTGSEIPENEREKIFGRFYRMDKSRTKSTGGFGLGLSIAKTIVDRYHGEITANSHPVTHSPDTFTAPVLEDTVTIFTVIM